MLGWYIGVAGGFERSLGSEGKNLKQHLGPEDWREFESTYTGPGYGDIWESLLVIHRLFKRAGQLVGDHYGYEFPVEDTERALAFLKHVWDLPSDAQSIYSEHDAEDVEPSSTATR